QHAGGQVGVEHAPAEGRAGLFGHHRGQLRAALLEQLGGGGEQLAAASRAARASSALAAAAEPTTSSVKGLTLSKLWPELAAVQLPPINRSCRSACAV